MLCSTRHIGFIFLQSVLLGALVLLLPALSYADSRTFVGPGTYNLPLSGVNQIVVSGSGGGGGGAGGAWDSNDSSPGDGGGGGAAAVNNSVISIPSNANLTIVVGGGGQGGPGNWNMGSWTSGTSGGTTRLYVNGALVITLPGGGGAVWGSDYFNAGGSSGGAGGEAGAWGDRACGGSGAKGGDSLFGLGGEAVYGVAIPGNNGRGYGSGGSGASGGCNGNGGFPGGYGAPGFMTISWPTNGNRGSGGSSSSLSPVSAQPPSLPPGLCSPYYFCSNDNVYYKSITCKDSLYEKCPYGCSAGSCLPPPSAEFTSTNSNSPAGAFSATGHLQIRPFLVKKGDTVNVYWNVKNVSSCSVTGTNGDSWTGNSSGSAGKTTSPIIGQTTYTLSCAALPKATPASITETQTVNVIPTFQEK